MHNVAVLAMGRIFPFELGIAARVFGAARTADGSRLYDVRTCSIGGRPVHTSEDYAVLVENDETLLEAAETVVIVTPPPEGPLLHRGEIDDDVRRSLALVRPDARVVGICTSTFVLAAAGLLDGLQVTTHWAWVETFRDLFPAVDVVPNVLFVDSGRILTSAGAAAGVDACLHLVRRDHGTEVANRAARRCVVAPWRDGGQSQVIERPTPEANGISTAPTREWALRQISEPLTLRQLAAHSHMAVRTFTRRFRDEVGMSPTQWIAQQRVERARTLLEGTELSVEAVAAEAGFPSATILRRHMADALGVTPTAYRRFFQTSTPAR